MAEFQSPESLSRPASSSRSAAPPTRKLRDSCHSCAASKVKCNQVKPACARCINRGIPCEYVPTKRAGRKRDSRTSDTTKTTKSLPTTNSSMTSGPSHSTSLGRNQIASAHQSIAYSGILPDLHAFEPTSTLLGADPGFDDFFSSLMPLPPLETCDDSILQGYPSVSESGFSDSNHVASLHMPDSNFSVLDEEVSKLPNLFKPLTPPESRASVTSDAQSYQDFQAFQGFQGSGSESSCCCLIRALAILKQQFSSSRSPAYDKSAYQQLSLTQDVIKENVQVLQAINHMLDCACSQEDGYLLSIVSLVVSKLLSRYGVAAIQTPNTNFSGRTIESPYDGEAYSPYHSDDGSQLSKAMSSYCIDGEDQGRIAAQLVLGELHRVQRLVNLFSQRLKGYNARNVMHGNPGSPDNGQEARQDSVNASPFSAARLDILEADLRKHLRALSSEIVDMLRRG